MNKKLSKHESENPVPKALFHEEPRFLTAKKNLEGNQISTDDMYISPHKREDLGIINYGITYNSHNGNNLGSNKIIPNQQLFSKTNPTT